ncbi:putative Diphthamide synthase [Trypanosoma vivax]|uniref:Diphthine--ammonia ligase n=1 Tax=Trypanosoma vivax (strain Y486) TaxID=1055687 RepID=G0U9Q7_TRYVY|nr:putative endoribonuclease [Trypanosoma vivax]KAH8619127.1 putative Diphthamide synthase [Trypanosoma vivax]CCC52537.1 endoribonuclease putative [Trypanosoma vivax Y486]
MKTIALVSGGKDSILSILLALRYGHYPVVVANIAPASHDMREQVHEIDSYSFQTVGHEIVEAIASCMELPLRRAYVCAGQSKVTDLHYTNERDDEDEVECLYRLLRAIKEEFPGVEAVTSGAILSNYQRHRVEDVCSRLGLKSLAFLWQRPANEVLDIALALRVDAILVKTASIGLDPGRHLGLTLQEMRPVLEEAQHRYAVHGAGEGGEFETVVVNCPLFKRYRLEASVVERVIVDDNDYAPSGHAVLSVRRCNKTEKDMKEDAELLQRLPSLTFPSDNMRFLPQDCEGLHEGTRSLHPFPADHFGDSGQFWPHGSTVYISEPLRDEADCEGLLVNVFQRLTDDTQANDREVVSLVVFSPSIGHFATFSRVFVRFFPEVKPPGCTFVERKELPAFQVEVLAALRDSADRVTLHIRSASCWGAPSSGPFSSSNMATVSNERILVVSGCTGLLPSTQALATSSDVPFLASVTLSHVCHDLGIAEEGVVRDFVAQFAFAYANCINGLTCFGFVPTSVSHATFFLTDLRFASLLEPLWLWCGGSAFLADTSEGVACRVLHVTGLLNSGVVGMMLEVRVPVLEG